MTQQWGHGAAASIPASNPGDEGSNPSVPAGLARSSVAEQGPVKPLVAGSTPAESATPIVIQSAAAGDLAYVLSTWGRLYEQVMEGTPQRGFLHEFAPIQAKLIKRSQVLTAIRDGRIVGFIVYEPSTIPVAYGFLHWISVRKDDRRSGIGRKLLTASALTRPIVTTWTPDLRRIGLADAPYTPFWLRI